MGFNDSVFNRDSEMLARIAQALEAHTELLNKVHALNERIQKTHEEQYAANDEIRALDKRNLNINHEILAHNLAEIKAMEARLKTLDERRADASRKEGK